MHFMELGVVASDSPQPKIRRPTCRTMSRPFAGAGASARLMRNVPECALSNVDVEVSILTEPIRQVGVRKIDGAVDPGGSPGQESRMKRIMLTSVLLALAASAQQQTLAASAPQKAGDVPTASTAAVPRPSTCWAVSRVRIVSASILGENSCHSRGGKS